MAKITNASEHKAFDDVVVEIADKTVENLAVAMVKTKKVSSGKMVRSLRHRISTTIGAIEIDVFAVFYAKWVDSGRRKGVRRVPLRALLKWVRQRGITARDGRSDRSLAFAIQQNIFENGIKPANFIDEAQSKAQHTEEVTRALKIEVERGFENLNKAGF